MSRYTIIVSMYGMTIPVQIDIEVDALANDLGAKAIETKSGRASVRFGAVRVKISKEDLARVAQKKIANRERGLQALRLAKLSAATAAPDAQDVNRMPRGHGSPADRGSADSWYRRPKAPHYYPHGSYNGTRIEAADMTAAERKAYNDAYDKNEEEGNHKDYG